MAVIPRATGCVMYPALVFQFKNAINLPAWGMSDGYRRD